MDIFQRHGVIVELIKGLQAGRSTCYVIGLCLYIKAEIDFFSHHKERNFEMNKSKTSTRINKIMINSRRLLSR